MKKLIGVVLGLLLIAGPAEATVRWWHFNSEAPHSPVLVVKARCLKGEDSAAHLKLLSYSNSTVVYGCYRHGY
jgi:hypothetical protein